MTDRVFYLLMVLIGASAVCLSLVWPQGLGARSPGPFGHPTVAEQARAAAKAGKAKPPASAQGAQLKGPF